MILEIGGVSGGSLRSNNETDMGFDAILVVLADCTCVFGAEVDGSVGGVGIGIGRFEADMLGSDERDLVMYLCSNEHFQWSRENLVVE